MPSKLRCRLTYANVMATIAVFVALGGSSYAAITITGKNVKDSSLTGKDIKNSSLTTSDVKNRSLLALDFKSGQLPAGPQGAQGAKGDKGEKGDTGATGAAGTGYGKESTQGSGSLTTTESTLNTITVNAPANGFMMLTGNSTFSANGTNPNNQFLFAHFTEGASQVGDYWWWDPGDVDGWFDQDQSRTEVFAVTAGSHTYNLRAYVNTGTAAYDRAQITAVFMHSSL